MSSSIESYVHCMLHLWKAKAELPDPSGYTLNQYPGVSQFHIFMGLGARIFVKPSPPTLKVSTKEHAL